MLSARGGIFVIQNYGETAPMVKEGIGSQKHTGKLARLGKWLVFKLGGKRSLSMAGKTGTPKNPVLKCTCTGLLDLETRNAHYSDTCFGRRSEIKIYYASDIFVGIYVR